MARKMGCFRGTKGGEGRLSRAEGRQKGGGDAGR